MTNPYVQRRDEYGGLLEHSIEQQLLEAVHDLGAIPGINTTRIAELATRVIDRAHVSACDAQTARNEWESTESQLRIRLDDAAVLYRKRVTESNNRGVYLNDLKTDAAGLPVGKSKAHEFVAGLVNDTRYQAISDDLEAALNGRADRQRGRRP